MPSLWTAQNPPAAPFNFRKANWEAFVAYTEERFSSSDAPTSCSTGEATLRRIFLDATKLFIPKGNIPNMIPNLSDPTNQLIRDRNSIRASSHTEPRLPQLNQRIKEDIKKTYQKIWIERMEPCSHKYNATEIFSLIKQLKIGKLTCCGP